MFPPFPTEIAHQYCLKLIKQIEDGTVVLKQISKESEERKGQGIMLGCLVAQDKKNKKRKILYTVSGNSKVLESGQQNFIFVNPIVLPYQIENALFQNDSEIHRLTKLINEEKSKNIELQNDENISNQLKSLEQKRTELTDESLRKVFSLYEFYCFDKKKIKLNQIIQNHNGNLPPTGTGDCCAPKLLSYAFEHDLTPVSMDEIYYGNDTKSKKNGISYPPCDNRCGYILPTILGLEILYRDNDIVVINKQSGLLSVPGRTPDKKDCVEARVKALFFESLNQPAVHRLDMETSGILILALNKASHRNLEMQFANNLVHKKYEALLDGVLHGKPEGHIELKFRLDLENRPHQIYDEINGKNGITDWKKIGVEKWKNPVTGVEKKVTRIEFLPGTGRTHQLRLAASFEKGLNLPILGDSLYGKCEIGERLMLHASKIEFFHPTTGKKMEIVCKPSF